MAGYQCHGRHAGEAANQLIDFVDPALGALMHREKYRVDPTLPNRAHDIRHRAPVQNGKIADARGIETGPFGGGYHRRHDGGGVPRYCGDGN